MRWSYQKDELKFDLEELVEKMGEKTAPTKREVVGVAAKIFDPLGMLAPVTVLWKMLFQTTCREGLQWDEKLTGEPLREWRRLKAAMGEKTTITVPRCYNTGQGDKTMLVGFCDASEKAYAAAVYLRTGEEESRVQLVAAKTRVSPTKSADHSQIRADVSLAAGQTLPHR